MPRPDPFILEEIGLTPIWMKRGVDASQAESSVVEKTSVPIEQLDWGALAARVAHCTRCRLCEQRTQTVFGVGDSNADWMLVGEAPGANEDRLGDPFLRRQIALIRPKLILALGRFAAQSLLKTQASLSSLRTRIHRYEDVPVIVTYHPAYLLRNLADKSKAWADLCLAQRTYRDISEMR